MNSQDITRALIDTTVARAMVEMDADRNAASASSAILAASFPAAAFRIRFLPFFRIFCATMKARIIRRSTFCCAATIRKRFVSSASTSATTVLPTVRRFCARSRKNFPLLFLGCQAPSRQPHPGHLRFLVFASVVRTGLTYGIYSYQLRSMDHHEDMESYLAVIQSHPECAFLWFLSNTPLTEKQQKLLLSCPNLMVSLPIDAPQRLPWQKPCAVRKRCSVCTKSIRMQMLPLICSLLTTCIPRWNRVSFSFWSQMIRAQKKVSGLFPMLFNSTASPHTAILPDRSAGRLPQN